MPHTASLASDNLTLEIAGGKGRSLAHLIASGFDVPHGFVVTTSAYRAFTRDIQSQILSLAKPALVDGAPSFERSASDISSLFDDTTLSDDIRRAITATYESLPEGTPVAVRSSATAEDLPELSFAGQQDTFLNVIGADAMIDAVRSCWRSLWTPQAMNYRYEMDVDQADVAMAVVVQTMLPSAVSGVLFTANPATGARDEIIINSSFGLGESIVSGQVTPDTFVIDKETHEEIDTTLGDKAITISSVNDGGTVTEETTAEQRNIASLSPPQIEELSVLAQKVETAFDHLPQDIEWAIVDDQHWLLQSRPITNLPVEPPADVTWPEIPDAYLLKRQVAENMPDPLCPLFESMYLKGLFDTQKWPEGWPWEGIYTKNWMKNFVVTTVNGYAYQAIYKTSADSWKNYEKETKTDQEKSSWWMNLRRAFSMPTYAIDQMKGGPLHFIYLITAIFRSFRKFPSIDRWEQQQLPDYLAEIKRWEQQNPREATEQELMMGLRALNLAEARYWHALRAIIGTAKMTDGGLQKFLEEHAPEQSMISGTFLSGFSSKTLDAEANLRAIADQVREDPLLNELLLLTPASRLLATLAETPDAATLLRSIETHLQTYCRQVFNLDFVEPSLAEQPGPFLVNLKALVRTPGQDLETRQKNVTRNRHSAMKRALKFFKGRTRIEFLRLYWTARVNYPAREEALFYMGLAWSTFRPWALELGRRLADDGTLSQPDDIFYVSSEDIDAALSARASDQSMPPLGEQATRQRHLRQQRFRMHQPAAIPALETDDTSPHSTLRNNEENSSTLKGFAVSPGTVAGIASVIMTPDDFHKMQPNSILVCPLTTPAWTQLFPHAIGLATDIGSILAHGSIVAREYGIPAVLGIGDVTQRIQHGQRIEIDGDRGTVTILEDEVTSS